MTLQPAQGGQRFAPGRATTPDPPENGVGSGVPGRDRNAHPSMILGSPIPLSDGVSGDGVAANSGAIHVDNDRSAPNNESYFSLATLGARYYT